MRTFARSTNALARVAIALAVGTVMSGCAAIPDGLLDEGSMTSRVPPPATTSAFVEVMLACSVDGSLRFPQAYANGPELTRDELLAVPIGRLLSGFSEGGGGPGETGPFEKATGFSVVSETLVLGYEDGGVASFFEVQAGAVRGWGSCSPNLVRGDSVAVRWRPRFAVTRADSVISILVDAKACDTEDGSTAITEIVAINLEESDSDVKVTVWTRDDAALSGGIDCDPIGTALEAEVVLEGPLRRRVMLDGGTLPPMRVRRNPNP